MTKWETWKKRKMLFSPDFFFCQSSLASQKSKDMNKNDKKVGNTSQEPLLEKIFQVFLEFHYIHFTT